MAKRKADKRCYYCRRKATTTEGGHPSCGHHGGAVRMGKALFHTGVTPQVRPMLRSGRGKFLEMLRARIANVKADAYETAYQQRVLDVVDAAIARYKGD